MLKKISVFVLASVLTVSAVFAQRDLGVRPTQSGGVLMPEQASYDVKHYDLALAVDVPNQSITGVLSVDLLLVKPTDRIVFDLDQRFKVESVEVAVPIIKEVVGKLPFEHKDGKIWIELSKNQGKVKGGSMPKYKSGELRIKYSGKPKAAPAPPWVGGFVWSKTADGSPWFATAVQNDGADLWFPVKDHPSDKPDTVSLHFTVPKPLVAAANGKLRSVLDNRDGTRTFNWFVSQPISNYCIALNVAPYRLIEDEMTSVAGDKIPISFYVLPEHYEKGLELVAKTKDYVRFFEEFLGPFPWRADKLSIAETLHLGMEHQSIIAYGNGFKYDKEGVDTLMFHELGHEWWANLATAPDWNDFWIHEGFQSYMDALYKDRLRGSRDGFIKSLPDRIKFTKNLKPVAPREPRTTTEMYLIPPGYTKSDGDIYGKGALVLNTLRYTIGDEAFFRAIRRMVYPSAKMEKVKSGKQFHFATTDDFLRIAERESGRDLDWFFELYLRQPALPRLRAEAKPNELLLVWETPNKMPFPLPVEVRIAGQTKRVEMTDNKGSVALPAGARYEIDPNGWLLMQLLSFSKK